MAEGFGNETPENPGYAQFAKDFVNFVMFRKSPRYSEEKQLAPISGLMYSEAIHAKFIDILRIHELLIVNYIEELLDHIPMSPTGYITTINKLEKTMFDKDFTYNSFLNYCMHISAIAALFYNKGVDTAPELAESYIANVLKNRMQSDRWTNLREVIENFQLPDVQSSDGRDSNV